LRSVSRVNLIAPCLPPLSAHSLPSPVSIGIIDVSAVFVMLFDGESGGDRLPAEGEGGGIESRPLSCGKARAIFPEMEIKATSLRDMIVRTFRVSRKDIWYLHFIFEAYDGLGTVSSVDPREGVVRILIPVSREEEAELLLRELSREIEMEELAQ
jgi:Domain of unknown function (DUF4911)